MVLSIFAGKKKAIIFLILPLLLISSMILLLAATGNITVLNLIENKFIKKITVTDIPGLHNIDLLRLVAVGIPGFIFISSWIYGLHPAIIRTEKFFSKRGYENVVLEYEFIQKLLFVIIILLAIVLIILYSNLFYQDNT